jgi:hypothetical protein
MMLALILSLEKQAHSDPAGVVSKNIAMLKTTIGPPSTPLPSNRDRGTWTIAAYLGTVGTLRSVLTVSQPELGNRLRFDPVAFRSRSFDNPLYYGVRGGYFIARMPWLGVEGEFIHMKVYADPTQKVHASGVWLGSPINRELPLGEIVQQYSLSHGANLILVNVVSRYLVKRAPTSPAGRLLLTGRFGIGPTLPHTESIIDGRRQEQYQLGRVGWQLSGGVELHLWRGLYGWSEYKFTRTQQRGKVFLGEATSLLRSHHGVFGLGWHF